MADEVTNVSNKEQVIVCFHSIDESFEPHEDFVSIHTVAYIKADIVLGVLKDTILRLNLRMSDCRGKCYDGATNRCGSKSGVAIQLTSEEPHATCTFIHFYRHTLHLAVGDTVKKNRILRHTLDTMFEMSRHYGSLLIEIPFLNSCKKKLLLEHQALGLSAKQGGP